MNGQVFSVQVAKDHMEKILSAKDFDEVKQIAPWYSASALNKVLGGSAPGSPSATQKLVDAGAILPPFHPRCRTEVVLINPE